jgi:hypothetical protein
MSLRVILVECRIAGGDSKFRALMTWLLSPVLSRFVSPCGTAMVVNRRKMEGMFAEFVGSGTIPNPAVKSNARIGASPCKQLCVYERRTVAWLQAGCKQKAAAREAATPDPLANSQLAFFKSFSALRFCFRPHQADFNNLAIE